MEMATDPTVTVATGFLSLDETPMSIASFMFFWCQHVGKVFQVRAGRQEKERRRKVEGAEECQAAGSSALMQN
jgi:hypothetical protein